jgi:8-oxo-dGTP pyrophosphatase MutT (NUDIX family)
MANMKNRPPNKHQPCFYRVSIKGVIEIDGKVVLSREHGSKRWDLPGGGVEHYEDPMDAFSREIKEELGVEVVYFDEDHIQAWFMYDEDPGWDRPILYLVAHADISGKPNAGDGVEVQYFSKDELADVTLEKHVERFRNKLIKVVSEAAAK